MASDAQRTQLENRMHELLLKNDGVILLNSFWSFFKAEYHLLPDPAKYGLHKRNDLLSLFPSICTVDGQPGVPGNLRKVCVKSRVRETKGPTKRPTTSAVGDTATKQPVQKQKVKQSKGKLPDNTDTVAKSVGPQKGRLTQCSAIEEKESESVNVVHLSDQLDTLAVSQRKLSASKVKKKTSGINVKVSGSEEEEKPTPSTKGKKDKASKSSTVCVDEHISLSHSAEPEMMTSSKQENTHIRFADDGRETHSRLFQHVSPQTTPRHLTRGPYHMVSSARPMYQQQMCDYNRGYPPLSHVPAARPRLQNRHPMPFTPQQQPHVCRVSEEQMKNVVEDCIDRLVESKQYVSLERIEKLITQHFQVSSVGELGFRNIDSIPAVRDHQRLLCKVNAYIHAFVKVRSIATVFELGECLKEYATNGCDFEALRIGPLATQPLVYEFFKMPSDTEVPSVVTEEIFEHLRGYLGTNNLWADRNVQLEDFMKYLTEKYDVDTPFKLGIRIRSMPLLIGVLKKAQRDCGKSMGTTMTHIRETIEGDLSAAVQRFIATLVHKEPDICMIRQQCLDMNAPQLLQHVFKKFSVLMEFLNELQVVHPSSALMKVTRHCRTIQGFLQVFVKDELILRLFHFVVCCNNQEMYSQLSDILATEYQQLRPSNATDEGSRQELPSLDKVVKQMRKYLERCLMHGALSLVNLARVEEKLLEDFALPHFGDLGQGGFLQFLHDNDHIKQFLDECGGLTLGGTSVGTAAESAFHPSLSVLHEFVQQSGMAASKVQLCSLEGALCNHYRVKEVKSLGHGSMTHLVTTLEKQGKQNHESVVFYEGALCANSRNTVFNTSRQVGVLGHMTKEKALACLQSCPLLENMSEWSHWDFIFKPELGELKDFLHKYGGVRTIHIDTEAGTKMQMMTNILALETCPGTLLRISSSTTPEAFATAATAADVAATCGHLVSLVVANRGMSNMPQALLANHMMTSLLKIQGRHSQQVSETPSGDDGGSCKVVQFVLDCLEKMPLIVCEAVANQVLLEPLSKVVGSAKSKALLLHLADTGAVQTRLQLLGWLLGLADWTNSFQTRCNPPPEGVPSTHDDNFEDTVEILESSDESDDDHEDDTAILVLSDDDDDIIEIRSDATAHVDSVGSEPVDDGNTKDETVIKLFDTDEDNPMVDVSTDVVVKDKVKVDIDGILCLSDNPCWTLVEQIRRDEFGIGVALGEDGEKLMRKQQERLGRSLDRLSRDLYSKDTHFVLELIQNADDNDYPPEMFEQRATTVPSVKFVVESDCITVYNNECGFEGKNIRAVCDVGRSTKGKHKYGYIGQKGIGFKSVFRVTDRPEIHSNGFHICFNIKSSPMGYVLPHWVGGADDSGEAKDDNSWMTRIELPLKYEMRSQTQCRSLAARFHDVHPSLLLFLHRLKQLTVQNKVEGVTMKIERYDLGKGVVEIRHDNTVDRWLVVKHKLDASAISLQAKSGVEVESTEVALAFPLSNQGSAVAQTQPDKQRVFAYLPLRSYGFRFVIQGDFDVPSSREDIDRDSIWNQWLRSEIHSLFVDALQHFKTHPEFNEIEAVRYFIQFIPLEDEILEFFRPVASAILQQLRSEACLPTEVTAGTAIRWKMPSQLVLTNDPLVRDVITSSLLREHLGLDFLHKDVVAMLNPSLMQSLGIQVLMTSHLIEIGKVIVSRLTESSSAERCVAVVDVAKWLACVYRSLDEFDHNEELMAQLKDVVVVPLITGEVVSVATMTVFFPIDSAEQMRLSQKKIEGPLIALMQDLRMLLPSFLNALDSVSNSQLCSLLEKLGVKHLRPQEVILHHIMPTLKSDQWQKRSEGLLIDYIVYLKQQWDQHRSVVDMNELRPVAVVMTSKGRRRPVDEPIHFSRQYGNRIDLPNELPGYDWLLLHDCYLKSGGSRWREFFTELGVLDFLSVRERVVTIAPPELESTPWATYKTMLPAADEYRISDYECVEFAAMVRSCSAATQCEAMHRQMKMLFTLLDHEWDTKYSKYTTTQITDGDGSVLRHNVDTSFALQLKSSPWLPTSVMRVSTANNKFTVVLSHEIKVGRDLFIRVPAISHLLGDHVPYLEATPSAKSTFPQFLGIQNSIKVEFVVDLLKGWCERKSPGSARQFNTSMEHIKAIYGYLFENMVPKVLQDLIHDCPLIFIPSVQPICSSTKVDGAFLGRNELRWDDPSGLFADYSESLADSDSADAYKPVIKPVYHDMEDFFLRCARIARAPELVDYAQLLVHIAITVPLPKALPDVLRIFTIIGHTFAREPELVIEHAAKLTRVLQTSSAPIPVKGARWVALSSQPMVADDKAMARLFQGKDGVNFVDLGESLGAGKRGRNSATDGFDRDMVLLCLRELGVHTLSECLTEDYVTEMYQPCSQLQQYVHDVLPIIQTLLCNDFQAIYERLVAGNIAEKIKAMKFVKVGRLELVYSLKHKPDTVVVQSEKCRLVRDEELCVHQNHVTSFNEVNKELARYFCSGDMQCRTEIRDLLLELLPLVVNPSEELQQFVKQRRLDELPPTEEHWQVEPPVFYHQPPRIQTPRHQFEESTTVDEGQGHQDHGNQDNSGGLKAWPPRSGDPDMRYRGGSGGGGSRQMWPPPAPPEGVDYTALPASLRPSKLPPVRQEGTTSHPSGDDGKHVSRPHGDGESGHAIHTQGIKRESPTDGVLQKKRTIDENGTLTAVTMKESVLSASVDNASASQDTQQVAPVEQEGTGESHLVAPVEPEDAEPDADKTDEIVTPPKKRRRSETFDVLHQRMFTDSAVWLQDSEIPYEHVDIGTLVLPEGMAPADGDQNAEVGRWGEQLVYSYLSQATRGSESKVVSVLWINEDKETGDPFDIVMTIRNGDDPGNDQTIFVEVKSTASDSKNFFEMSLQQIDFARKKTDAFHLYRVYNAGHQTAVRLMRLENLSLKLERKEVRLCMFV